MIDDIQRMALHSRFELGHNIRCRSLLPSVSNIDELKWTFISVRILLWFWPGRANEQGSHHLHVGLSREIEIGPLTAGETPQVVAHKAGGMGPAAADHHRLDIVPIDVAAFLAAERQRQRLEQVVEGPDLEAGLMIEEVPAMLLDAMTDLVDARVVTVGEDAQAIEALIDDGLFPLELRFEKIDGPIVRAGLDERAPALVILAKKLREAIEREPAGCLTADLFEDASAVYLLRSIEVVPTRGRSTPLL